MIGVVGLFMVISVVDLVNTICFVMKSFRSD